MGARKKIPQEELDRIKCGVSVADLARRRGVELNPHGKDLIGLCPFHNDTNPSLVITPDKNLWHCLGACQAGGDVIEWVMKSEAVSFRHAIELLRRSDVGLTPASNPSPVKATTVKKLPPPFEITADDQLVLRQVVDFYHETLKESPEALAYLEKRKIGHAGAIEQFKLGYANRTLGYRLPFANRRVGWEIRGRLVRFGIYRASGHEHFSGNIVFPIIDEENKITEIYGRRIQNPTHGAFPHLYLPGPHKGVWNVSSLAASKEVILCEALIDALTFWCAGYRNVTASYGVEGFTADHLAAFKKYGVQKVLIAYDRDEAGEKAARKLAPILMKEGCEIFRVEFPPDQDANDYASAVSDPADALGQLLRGAVWLGKSAIAAPAPTIHAGLSSPAIPQAAAKEENIFPLAADEAPAIELLTPAPPDPSTSEPLTCETPSAITEPKAATNRMEEVSRRTGMSEERPANPAAGGSIDFSFEERRWRVRGLSKNMSFDQMRVTVRVAVHEKYHIDTLDLYNARHRTAYVNAAAHETIQKPETIKRDLGKVLMKLEEIQEAHIRAALSPKEKEVVMTDEDRQEALAFLTSSDILNRIVKDVEEIGVVGEEINVLTGYLACVSRKFDDPLAVIIQSSSAAGKSALMDAALSLMPEEEREKFTAVTGQALFYMEEMNLKHKIIAIVEEQGAEKATYALKLLQSEGRLKIAATGKDPITGKLTTRVYTVEGPVVIFITTTNVEIEDELLNRVLVLTVNEDRDQTRRIHDLQRAKETLAGIVRQETRAAILRRHQNAQRLLRPIRVANPYAPRLTFLDTQLRTRRDHPKYLALIRSIAFLHQYQRSIRQTTNDGKTVSYIEVEPSDIEAANRIANVVLGRSLDELPPQTRRLLLLLDDMVTKRCEDTGEIRSDIRFSRRETREFTGWSDTALKIHLSRLADMEYLLPHRSPRGVSFVYELLYDGRGKDGSRFCMGLIDVSTLKDAPACNYDAERSGKNGDRSGQTGERSGSGQPSVSPRSGGGQGRNFHATLSASKVSRQLLRNWTKTHGSGNNTHPPVVGEPAETK